MDTLSSAQLERIAALVKADKPLPKAEVFQLPCEVTALIPCFDALCWEWGSLFVTLDSLLLGHQSVPVKLILCDNGSRDGTQDFLRALKQDDAKTASQVTRSFWLERFPAGIEIAEPVPENEEYPAGQNRINQHLRVIYQRMLELVDTDYVLTVDADVEVPRGAVRTMLDALKNDVELGMVGIGYGPADHIQHGLAMMRTEDMRSAKWPDPGPKSCTCRVLNDEVKRMGKKVLHLSPLSARHTKMERG